METTREALRTVHEPSQIGYEMQNRSQRVAQPLEGDSQGEEGRAPVHCEHCEERTDPPETCRERCEHDTGAAWPGGATAAIACQSDRGRYIGQARGGAPHHSGLR